MTKKIILFLSLILSLTANAQETSLPWEQTFESGYFNGDNHYVAVPVADGNYKVTVRIGSKRKAGHTTVRAESRRLMLHNVVTKKGEVKEFSFIVNKRNTTIYDKDGNAVDRVRIKEREKSKLNWDDLLTIEISGDNPQCSYIKIEKAADDVPVMWLCGNSTVVDQDYEPWASWGQMITRWMDSGVAVANYAESGETATSFIGAGRLKKIASMMKKGDYIFIEFGHNDQKEKRAGSGARYNFAYAMKQFVDEARAVGATPVFVTPTQRRNFNGEGKINETHGDYPDAMRWVAKDLDVPVIELHDMTRTLFETLGVEDSKRALVHYPAGSYPGQDKAFEDNTHFNPYGAYEVAKMVVEGIRQLDLPLAKHIVPEYMPFNPAQPDDWRTFHWNDAPFAEVAKPDGN